MRADRHTAHPIVVYVDMVHDNSNTNRCYTLSTEHHVLMTNNVTRYRGVLRWALVRFEKKYLTHTEVAILGDI